MKLKFFHRIVSWIKFKQVLDFFSDHGQPEPGVPEEDRHVVAGQQGLRPLRAAGTPAEAVQLKASSLY